VELFRRAADFREVDFRDAFRAAVDFREVDLEVGLRVEEPDRSRSRTRRRSASTSSLVATPARAI
jgi:hypothetical protein